MKKCPFCAEEIQDEAIFCRYCNHDLIETVSKPILQKPAIVNSDTQPAIINSDVITILKFARSYLNNGFWGLWLLQVVLFGIVLFFGGLGSTSNGSGTPLFLGLSSIVSIIGLIIFLLIRQFLCYRTFQVTKKLRYSQISSFFITLAAFLSPFYTYLGLLININKNFKSANTGKYILPPVHDYQKTSLAIKLLFLIPLGGIALIYILLTISRFSPTYNPIPANIPVSTQILWAAPSTPMATSIVQPEFVNIFDDFSSVNNSVFSKGDSDQAKFFFEDSTYNIQLRNGNPDNWSYLSTSNSLTSDQNNVEYSVDVRVKGRDSYKNPSEKQIDIPIEYGLFLGSIEDNVFIGFTLVEWKGKIRLWRIQPQDSTTWYDSNNRKGSFTKMNAFTGNNKNLLELQSSVFNKIGDGYVRISIHRSNNKIGFFISNILVFETNLDKFYFDTSYGKNGYQPTLTPSDKYLKLKEFGVFALNYGLDPQIQFDNLEIKTNPE